MEIKFFNRKKNIVEQEKVYGGFWVNCLYQTSLGKWLEQYLSRRFFSQLVGLFESSTYSKKKIAKFIAQYKIDMTQFQFEDGHNHFDPYSSFNSFFIRKFKEGQRPFTMDSKKMPAFCEARYYGFSSVDDHLTVPVKGELMSASALLNHHYKWSRIFKNGPMLIARLCPVDYHRFHFPDDGEIIDNYRIHGAFHSVNPVALKEKPEVFKANERHVTILETKNFGKLAYIDVGATCVGKIVQTHYGLSFHRGDEKGYFLFGGSTVILLGEKGKWIPSADILQYTEQRTEVYLELGDVVSNALPL